MGRANRGVILGHHDEEVGIASCGSHCFCLGLLSNSHAWRGYLVSRKYRVSELVGRCCLCAVRDPDWGIGIVYRRIQTEIVFRD